MSEENQAHPRGARWRGFSLQLFLVTVLPLTVLLLVVAFGSQALHMDAMRSLVGDRDLKAVRAAANSLDQEIADRALTIQILARGLDGSSDLSRLLLGAQEIPTSFDGGVALFSPQGELISATKAAQYWPGFQYSLPGYFASVSQAAGRPVFSHPVAINPNQTLTLVSVATSNGDVLAGAFSPAALIQGTLASTISADQTSVLVVGPGGSAGSFEYLYRAGPTHADENSSAHPGILDSLNGQSGVAYTPSSSGEHVVAFSPIPSIGWGLVIEEPWEVIASPYLRTTQEAPLVIVPVFLLALVALWFGARRIVQPLQVLEKRASELAEGDYKAIRKPVGGIQEIRNLQNELVDMADKLQAAHQSLRSYIGAITAGIENERRSLARELHDDTIQALIALNQRIQLATPNAPETQKKTLAELQGLVQQTITNLRRMIRGLRPIYLEDLGLVASLEMLARETARLANVSIAFSSQGEERRLDAQKEMALYRMVQELLSNVARHAEASQASVSMAFDEAGLSIEVRDNGKGFIVPANPAEFPARSHFGLLGLQERAEAIGAQLRITSRLGEGTSLSIRVGGLKEAINHEEHEGHEEE